ncbi:valine--tRNA ligase [Sulfolobales archaeon HS-7]|nr:valine--tRNA ligase [Sulfolobales archaeon HS-7]
MVQTNEVIELMKSWPSHYNPKEIEEKWQRIWLLEEYWKNVFRFKSEDHSKPAFVIDTPPPFTSGELHMGHAYWVSMIDAIARSKRLQGFNVLHPQGWDTQGLPTELKVQYRLRIPKENRQLFLEKCIEWTEKMIANMKSGMIRLGYRPEWERYEYRTYSKEYRRVIQLSLIDMARKGFLELRYGPVYWCPHCETSLAQSEVGYKEASGLLNTIKFPLKDGDEIRIATTRPELIPAVQAIVINPNDTRYKALVGKKAISPIFNKEIPIIEDEAVDMSFGTGAVMVCTYGDPQDVKWQLKYSLPVSEIIDEKGRIKNTGILDGLTVEEARKKILEMLKNQDYLIDSKPIRHNILSHTERSDCGYPIEFLVKKQLYIKVLPFTDLLLKKVDEMTFKPTKMKYFLKEWIKGLEWDWNISRQRVYGTPLPFWFCDNDHLIPAEESSLPIDPREITQTKKCPVCGLTLKPITDVADVWIDSSVTLLYLTQYYDNKELIEYAFPGNLRVQGTDIIRTWLFYTLFRTWAITGKLPFSEALIHGQVLGPDNSRMSKSKGNVVSPLDRIDEYGADAIRMTLLGFSIGDDFPFKWETVRGRKLLLQKLWNACRLLYPFVYGKDLKKPDKLSVVDKWILYMHKTFIINAINNYNSYDFFKIIEDFHRYFWEVIADEYLEMIKYRLFENDDAAIFVARRIIKDLLIVIHPLAPHITEELYSRMFGDRQSILLERFPDVSDIEEDEYSLKVGNAITKINSAIRTEKIRQKLSMNTPVNVRLTCDEELKELVKIVEKDIKNTLKIENLEILSGNQLKVEVVRSDHGS